MALQPERTRVAMSLRTNGRPHNLFRTIATDIHFWIPLGVLVAGLALLGQLR